MSPPAAPQPPAPPSPQPAPPTLCNFPAFTFNIPLPSLIALIPLPDIDIKLPFQFPPDCPLD